MRLFCSICGINVITTNEGSEFVKGKVIVMSGCLDVKDEFPLQQDIYCRDRCAWMEVLSRTKRYDGMV